MDHNFFQGNEKVQKASLFNSCGQDTPSCTHKQDKSAQYFIPSDQILTLSTP
jgi:hypothetical protein